MKVPLGQFFYFSNDNILRLLHHLLINKRVGKYEAEKTKYQKRHDEGPVVGR